MTIPKMQPIMRMIAVPDSDLVRGLDFDFVLILEVYFFGSILGV